MQLNKVDYINLVISLDLLQISEENRLAKFLISHGKPFLAIMSVVALALFATTLYLNRQINSRYQGISVSSRQHRTHQPGPLRIADATHETQDLASLNLTSLIEDERVWLAGCQLPNGALAQAPGSNTVIPYFANLAAKTLVNSNPEAAQEYISWYLSNLNKPDRWGLSGTIYDYRVEYLAPGEDSNSAEIFMQPTRNYDSADSYASTFLSLVADYYFTTQDKDLIRANLEDINLVAKVIVELQDEDGLIFVKPGSWTKYLMDNAENYRGLMDWSQVLDEEGYAEEADRFKYVAAGIKDGINHVLYDPEKGAFAWSLSPIWKRFPKEGKWYPDGVSQLYLLTCGLISPGDPKAVTIWHDFNHNFPEWKTGAKKDKFPWGSVALASLIMGDSNKALEFAGWANETFLLNDRPYPWYVLKSANLITLLEHILAMD